LRSPQIPRTPCQQGEVTSLVAPAIYVEPSLSKKKSRKKKTPVPHITLPFPPLLRNSNPCSYGQGNASRCSIRILSRKSICIFPFSLAPYGHLDFIAKTPIPPVVFGGGGFPFPESPLLPLVSHLTPGGSSWMGRWGPPRLPSLSYKLRRCFCPGFRRSSLGWLHSPPVLPSQPRFPQTLSL